MSESKHMNMDTWAWDEKHALELAKRAVGLEHLAESNEATHLAVGADVVVGETMRQKASTVSGSWHWSLS